MAAPLGKGIDSMTLLMVRSNTLLGIALLAMVTGQASAQGREFEAGGRGRAYVNSLIGAGALVSLGISTVIDHRQDDPLEWGDGTEGFAKRLGSNAARNLAQESVRHGLAAVLGRSVTYQRCECNGFFPRVGNAVVEVVTDRNRDGDRMIAISRFAGAYAGAAAETLWHPDRSGAEVINVAANTLLWGTVSNLWREFVGWPK